MEIDSKLLHKVFEYKDGKLFWREVNTNRLKPGQEAGYLNHYGYRIVNYSGSNYSVHRLIWIMFNGPIPEGFEIDHIDGDRANNDITNLRLATSSENGFNSKIRSDNKTGVKGVHWCSRSQRYIGKLHVDGKSKYIGSWMHLEEAECAVKSARKRYHKHFANTGV